MNKITIRLNNDLGGRKKGSEISIAVDSEGTALETYWRNRLADAAIDNCVTVLVEDKEALTKSTVKGSDNG